MKTSFFVLHNTNSGNNRLAAEIISEKLGCPKAAAEDNPSIEEFESIVIVAPNSGDEEIASPMENYLFSLKPSLKKFFVCELGNYFGFEDYCGCKKVVFKILEGLGWIKVSDISLDALPELDTSRLLEWIEHALLDDGQRSSQHDLSSGTTD